MQPNSYVQLWNYFWPWIQKWMKFAFIVNGSIFLQSYWVSDNVATLWQELGGFWQSPFMWRKWLKLRGFYFHHKRKSFKEYKKWFFAFFTIQRNINSAFLFQRWNWKEKDIINKKENFLQMHRRDIQTFWIEDPFTLFSNFLSKWYLY